MINGGIWALSGLLGFAVWGEVGLKPSNVLLSAHTLASSTARVPDNEQCRCCQLLAPAGAHAVPVLPLLQSRCTCVLGKLCSEHYSKVADISPIQRHSAHVHELLIDCRGMPHSEPPHPRHLSRRLSPRQLALA